MPWTRKRPLASQFRSVLSVSSHFKVPEQGMKEYEMLSRGTAFCLSLPGPPRAPSKLVLVTCSHVLAPYKWRQHFKEPWLEFVKDEHVECRIQAWKEEEGDPGKGQLGDETRVQGLSSYHHILDLCMLPVHKNTVDAYALRPLEDRDQGEPLAEGEELTFVGFPSAMSRSGKEQEKLGVLPPRRVQGRALASVRDKQGRFYAKTEERLAVGMSGGPVLDRHGRCCGIFQGILPPAPQTPQEEKEQAANDLDPILRPLQIAGWERHAGFIPLAAVRAFLEEKK
jgi:hypothetical protein